MQLYYFLLNEVEVKYFGYDKIEIYTSKVHKNLSEPIKQQLFAWTGLQLNVIIIIQSGIQTLKDQIITKIKLDEQWQLLTRYFATADITELLLKQHG